MDEGVAGPIRELDKAIPLVRIVPLYFARNRQNGWFGELWLRGLWLRGLWLSGLWLSGLWLSGLWLSGLWLSELWLGELRLRGLQRGLGSAPRVAGSLVLDNLPSSS
jgi:hypothetical protein